MLLLLIDLENTQLLTFIEIHVTIQALPAEVRFELHFYMFLHKKDNQSHKPCSGINTPLLGLTQALTTKLLLNTPDIYFMFYACTCLI